jgi:hypothetical protein
MKIVDNNMQNKNPLFPKILMPVALIIIILNLAYIDIFMFKNSSQEQGLQTVIMQPSPPSDHANQVCSDSCLNQIRQATASSGIIPTKTPALAIAPTIIPQVKEFFIPFGNGTNSSGDWEDVGGLKTLIDSSKYPSIKSITFEASVSIPTANQTAYVRLFNETDQHPVWFSDVSMEGGTPQFLISKPIALDSGNKVYKVQMKTSLKFQAILNQARIHIIIK